MALRSWFAGAAVVVLGAGVVVAQEAPESLLPPGFDDPAPAPAPTPAPLPTVAPQSQSGSSTGGSSVSRPVVQGGQGGGASVAIPAGPSAADLARLPSLEELEEMSPDDLDQLLGLRPRFDIPPAARRALSSVGLLDTSEGGLPSGALAKQPAGLVRAVLEGTKGPMVSRWGHIMLRKALVSRLEAPEGMTPIEFVTLRVQLLNHMGEFTAARALAQEVDTGNWSDELTDAAVSAYIGTADIVGACPATRLQGGRREDAEWVMLSAICAAYAGETAGAANRLDDALDEEIAPEIDVLLARRYAGAAGSGRRGVTIEWEGVGELTPWRFALANAVGESIPETLQSEVEPYYERVWATMPMASLAQRAQGAQRAAREGLMSSQATVDLYSQIYADENVGEVAGALAGQLREAYVASSPADRVAAMRGFWGEGDSYDYGGYVTTAYAAARLPASADLSGDADDLVAAMLAAGLDRDANAWRSLVETGSEAWAMIELSSPTGGMVSDADVDAFFDQDDSNGQRKSQFLVAGLAGLDRLNSGAASSLASSAGFDISRQTRWSRAIEQSAQFRNSGMVALLAGLGMQGARYDQMTPLHLYHIVSALNQVGMEAEARMIAAEAIARG